MKSIQNSQRFNTFVNLRSEQPLNVVVEQTEEVAAVEIDPYVSAGQLDRINSV